MRKHNRVYYTSIIPWFALIVLFAKIGMYVSLGAVVLCCIIWYISLGMFRRR